MTTYPEDVPICSQQVITSLSDLPSCCLTSDHLLGRSDHLFGRSDHLIETYDRFFAKSGSTLAEFVLTMPI